MTNLDTVASGPFWPDPDLIRPYPVRQVRNRVQSGTERHCGPTTGGFNNFHAQKSFTNCHKIGKHYFLKKKTMSFLYGTVVDAVRCQKGFESIGRVRILIVIHSMVI